MNPTQSSRDAILFFHVNKIKQDISCKISVWVHDFFRTGPFW